MTRTVVRRNIPLMKNLRRGVCAAFTAALLLAAPAPAQAQTSSLSSLSSHSSGSSQAAGVGTSLLQSGFGFRVVTVDGMVRPYTVVLPRNYNPFKAYPVIIGFGGWQHNAGRTRSYEQLERAAGDRAIVVYPQGMDNAWGGAPYARTSMKSDIRFVRAVVANLGAMHKIDKKRVYAAGLSNGGGLALALACHAPDLVAGVAGVSGAYYNPTVTNCAPGKVDTLIMHADNDDTVHYNGGTRHGAPYRSVPDVYKSFSQRNGTAARTELHTVPGGGHTWFPGATNRVVRFFLG